MQPSQIAITDFSYDLPESYIALYPLPNRAQSKLLVYKNNAIEETVFSKFPGILPENSSLFFNNTKVINARLSFFKTTGSRIEIFCLEPAGKVTDYSLSLQQTGSCIWQCLVGGASKWKEPKLENELIIANQKIVLCAVKKEQIKDAYLIEFSWTPAAFTFAEILEGIGKIPLPPYLNREAEVEDLENYQTVYAKEKGSVAAPTAGLHFTENLLEQLKNEGVGINEITLHVGAGTFKPVKAALMQDHVMHAEYLDVSVETLENLIAAKEIIAVGTTSLRTLESLYWIGVKIILQPEIEALSISQWEVYEAPLVQTNCTVEEAINALVAWLKNRNLKKIFTQTQIIIAPGYQFRVADGLITNFHQPQSTLLLLVAAAIGDNWKKMYEYALANNFRFLSYGDANYIEINKNKTRV